ncbi:ABC transporter permease [Flagellimonas sp. S3867]|uniref:ABC transporter permease n=1 Tax=Flagellimonas sp. S3867 TaxID=2768063 RepID=UPI0016898786|nr:ABC transporter permease [Flagellimonas sp. S3867]
MLKHNILLFLRNIKKNKGTFVINTLGLGIGIASFLVLSLYVYKDVTYNSFNENLANIYRVQERYEGGDGIQTKGLVLPKIMEEIPEVTNGTRIFDWDGYRLSHNNIAFYENIFYVDNGFFSIFNFPFLEGSAKGVLDEKYSVVISKPLAEKYFGTTSAVGKQFQVGFDDVFMTVKGVVDIPENSSVQFDIVASYKTGEELSPWIIDVHDWYNTFSETYVVLQEGIRPKNIQDKLQKIVAENFLPVGKNTAKLHLLPFADYHATIESNQTLIIILGLIALGIMGIALVNFINLSITNALSRTREIGVKKVHGANKNSLFKQILTESMLVSLVALLFGIVLMHFLLLPSFNTIFETTLIFKSSELTFLIIVLVSIWLIVGLVSAFVPFLIWARGKLIENLQGKVLSKNKPSFAKYSSIVIQFVIAIVLISGTFLIQKQVNFMIEKDPNFDKENVIIAQTDYWQFKDLEAASKNLHILSKEIEASPYVTSIGFTGSIPGDYDENYNSFYPEGKSELSIISLRKSYVGENYLKTLGIPILSGQGFDKNSTSLENTVVLNKTAMDKLGFKRAEGQIIREGSASGKQYKIIGVIDDFSYQGAQHNNQPLAHFYSTQNNLTDWDYLTIKTEKGASLQVLNLLQEKWKTLLPDATLTYFFSDNKLNAYYKEYERVNKLITWFSILAIILSCIGLFALSAYAMAKRTKEIGIRKVNGATIGQIMTLLNTAFIKWVLIAFLIAVPISWFSMTRWLEGFAHKTSISWWVFGVGGFTTMVIALATVSWQSFKAAMANPVDVLRDE